MISIFIKGDFSSLVIKWHISIFDENQLKKDIKKKLTIKILFLPKVLDSKHLNSKPLMIKLLRYWVLAYKFYRSTFSWLLQRLVMYWQYSIVLQFFVLAPLNRQYTNIRKLLILLRPFSLLSFIAISFRDVLILPSIKIDEIEITSLSSLKLFDA